MSEQPQLDPESYAQAETGHGLVREGDDEVDVSLIRWFLTLTPAQRLDTLDTHCREILAMREAMRRA